MRVGILLAELPPGAFGTALWRFDAKDALSLFLPPAATRKERKAEVITRDSFIV